MATPNHKAAKTALDAIMQSAAELGAEAGVTGMADVDRHREVLLAELTRAADALFSVEDAAALDARAALETANAEKLDRAAAAAEDERARESAGRPVGVAPAPLFPSSGYRAGESGRIQIDRKPR